MRKITLLILFLISTICNAQQTDESLFFKNLLPYAELANAIYSDEKTIATILKKHALILDTFDTITGLEISYVLASNNTNKQQIIVVRGTANLENAFVDMNIKLLPDTITGQNLHQGFSESASLIRQAIKNKLKDDYKLVTTGHSLGGAVALILAMQLDADKQQVERVITFGQPKVTNLAGSKNYQHLNVTRVVRPKDVVPLVPPLDPLEINNLDIYWHFGKEILLMGNKQYAILDGLKSMQRSMEFLTVLPSQENTDNHTMSGYLALISENSRQVSRMNYKSSFNPFGLFGQN